MAEKPSVKDPNIRPTFFPDPAAFRAWLNQHYETEPELWVGFYKVGSGKPSITWPQAVDQALCFGWIDAVRVGIDEQSYRIRFCHRKPGSVWSKVNIAKVEELGRQGLMLPKGIAAFEARKAEKSGIYSFEQEVEPQLGQAFEDRFKLRTEAWDFFQTQAPWYRRTSTWYVVSAKKEETRQRRFDELVEACAQGRKIKSLDR